MVAPWVPPGGLAAVKVGAPSDTVKALLIIDVKPGDVATRGYPVPALLMLRSENVAKPLTAVTVKVPLNVAAGEPGPIAIVIGFVAVVTVFLLRSCTATTTGGEIVTPAVAGAGT